MKIVRRGVPPGEIVWVGTCHVCHSRMHATEAELHDITYDQREGGKFGRAHCPVCPNRDVVFYPRREGGHE